MPARKHQSNAYQAWTYALAGLLALTNAAWFLSSRITANDHAAQLRSATVRGPVGERVIYEYRDRTPQPAVGSGVQRRLESYERCQPIAGSSREGVVISKLGNAWSSDGERRDPTLV